MENALPQTLSSLHVSPGRSLPTQKELRRSVDSVTDSAATPKYIKQEPVAHIHTWAEGYAYRAEQRAARLLSRMPRVPFPLLSKPT